MLPEMRGVTRIGSLLAILVAAVGVLGQGAFRPEVTVVSFGGSEVVHAFNSASERTRLVLVFSPT